MGVGIGGDLITQTASDALWAGKHHGISRYYCCQSVFIIDAFAQVSSSFKQFR